METSNFTTLQVLAKSAKVIPVMLMGKLVSRAQYKNYEYATAVLISVGMTAFLLGSDGGKKGWLCKMSGGASLDRYIDDTVSFSHCSSLSSMR